MHSPELGQFVEPKVALRLNLLDLPVMMKASKPKVSREPSSGPPPCHRNVKWPGAKVRDAAQGEGGEPQLRPIKPRIVPFSSVSGRGGRLRRSERDHHRHHRRRGKGMTRHTEIEMMRNRANLVADRAQ